jgi:hypothetical protein
VTAEGEAAVADGANGMAVTPPQPGKVSRLQSRVAGDINMVVRVRNLITSRT